MEGWNGPARRLIYSLGPRSDESRGFVRGAKWNLMPIPGVLNVLNLYRHRPFEERWEKAGPRAVAAFGSGAGVVRQH